MKRGSAISAGPEPAALGVAASALWRALLVALLALATTVWAAAPLVRGAPARITLIAAVAACLGGAAQLALTGTTAEDPALAGSLGRIAASLITGINATPWAEVLIIAAVALEAEHPSRPWHTAVLTVALLSYLFAFHLAETGAHPRVLRPQLTLLAAGAGLGALAIGATALPATATGPAAIALQVVGAVAALIAAVLATPVWLGRGTGR